jgi:hypothetical protein
MFERPYFVEIVVCDDIPIPIIEGLRTFPSIWKEKINHIKTLLLGAILTIVKPPSSYG